MQLNIPPHQNIELAWYGEQMARDREQWIVNLDEAAISEIETAAKKLRKQGKSIVEISRLNFRLPTLDSIFKKLKSQLTKGIGFVLLKRLPVERYSTELSAIMFYGMGAHLGNARMQNAKGHVLGHVRDLKLRSDSHAVRIYQTRERQTFHTDSSDIVGLLCLNKAIQGGESLLVSAVTIYNEMLKSSPRQVRLLFDPIATDRRGEIPQGMEPYFSIPVFNWYEDNLTVMYQRQYINSAQRFDDAMKLTSKHIQALDAFDALANDPRLNLSMQLEPGDMQFVYNHGLLHDRTEFSDSPDLKNRRHLLRLWLSAPQDRKLPEVFRQRYGCIDIGNRGGISIKGVEPCAPLVAE